MPRWESAGEVAPCSRSSSGQVDKTSCPPLACAGSLVGGYSGYQPEASGRFRLTGMDAGRLGNQFGHPFKLIVNTLQAPDSLHMLFRGGADRRRALRVVVTAVRRSLTQRLDGFAHRARGVEMLLKEYFVSGTVHVYRRSPDGV